ncbi:MAG: IS66 family transposase [Caulobacteraceae bacterium]
MRCPPATDAVGAVCTVVQPIRRRIEEHVFAAERLHADDTTFPSWPSARPTWRDVGPTSATIAHSGAPIRRRRYSTTRDLGVHPQQHLAAYPGILSRHPAGGRLHRL